MRTNQNPIQALFGFAVIASLASACGPMSSEVTDSVQARSIDGVKLISMDITDYQDPATMLQSSYVVGPRQRLLLRFEELSKEANNVRTEDGKKVEALITPLSPTTTAQAQSRLKLCPVTHIWMNWATWDQGHPFGGSERRWKNPGGDYDTAGCVVSTTVENSSLVFDVTAWFLDYVRGRGQNFGLILIADLDTEVAGESSGSYSPRLRWKTSSVNNGWTFNNLGSSQSGSSSSSKSSK